MRTNCINSTSSRKSFTGKGFSDIDFLYTTWKMSPFDATFRLIVVIFTQLYFTKMVVQKNIYRERDYRGHKHNIA